MPNELTVQEKKEKMLSGQLAQKVEGSEQLDAEIRILTIPYIDRRGVVVSRPFRLILPRSAERPMPLVFVAHYAMDVSSPELRRWLRNGWAVGCVGDFIGEYNEQLCEDDLVFNSAAYHTLRNLPEIDRSRIAVTGGSAGGYMTLMLTGLHLGVCCSVADCPVANIRFTLHDFLRQGYDLYHESVARLTPEQRAEAERLSQSPVQSERYRGMTDIQLPVLASIADCFLKVNDSFPDPDDLDRYALLSPIGLAKAYSSPFVVNHSTADGLVPVVQISRRLAYPTTGDSLPADFNPRLPDPPKHTVDYALEELLPPEKTSVELRPGYRENIPLPFDPEKPFRLNVYDEGPMQSYSGHRLIDAAGSVVPDEYFRLNFQKTARKTVWLTPEKLGLMLDRWLGRCGRLPVFEGVDDTVYGSLAVAKQEVGEELNSFVEAHSAEDVWSVAEELFRLAPARKDEWERALREILG